jgi:hypothetical protein
MTMKVKRVLCADNVERLERDGIITKWLWELTDDDLLAAGIVVEKWETVVGMKMIAREGVPHNIAMSQAWFMGLGSLGGAQFMPRNGRNADDVRVDPDMLEWANNNTSTEGKVK